MEKLVYYPSYLLDYTCKCGTCRRTCCTGRDWNISMNRAEYAGVACAARTSPRLEALAALFTPGSNSSEDDTVPVPLQDNGLCALLESNGTCAWRVHSGGDICSICREFPITYLRLFDTVYAYPSGGCEAVLEALMHTGSPIELHTRPHGIEEQHTYQLDVSESTIARNSVYGAYPTLAALGIDTLQNERYPLDERMALLMAYLDMVDKMASVGQAGRLEAALYSVRDENRAAVLLEGCRHDRRPGNPAVRACSELYLCCMDSATYAPWARQILENLGFEIVIRNPKSRPTLRLRQPDYLERRREEYRAYLAQKESFLARVMVSIYLHNGIPLASPDPWSSSRYFAMCYALIKFGIVGYFGGLPTDKELIDFLVVALRAFAHNSAFYQNTVRWMDSLEFTNVSDFTKMVQW